MTLFKSSGYSPQRFMSSLKFYQHYFDDNRGCFMGIETYFRGMV